MSGLVVARGARLRGQWFVDLTETQVDSGKRRLAYGFPNVDLFIPAIGTLS
jgi:hypothetical protein